MGDEDASDRLSDLTAHRLLGRRWAFLGVEVAIGAVRKSVLGSEGRYISRCV